MLYSVKTKIFREGDTWHGIAHIQGPEQPIVVRLTESIKAHVPRAIERVGADPVKYDYFADEPIVPVSIYDHGEVVGEERPGMQRTAPPAAFDPVKARANLKAAQMKAAFRKAFPRGKGGGMFNPVKALGKGVKTLGKAAKGIGKGLGKVPVIGPGLKGVYDAGIGNQFALASAIASGKRLDKAALGHLKAQVSSVKAVAPYAQMVLSVVPGVGTGLSAAIGAGAALASGQPITKALLAGVRGALPGGPIAQSVFDVGQAIMNKEPIGDAAFAALPISPEAKKALALSLKTAKDLADGKPVDKSLIDAGRKYLPADIDKALTMGMAMGHGQALQRVLVTAKNPHAVNTIAKAASQLAAGKLKKKLGNAVSSAIKQNIGEIKMPAVRTDAAKIFATAKTVAEIASKGGNLSAAEARARQQARGVIKGLVKGSMGGDLKSTAMLKTIAIANRSTQRINAIAKQAQAKGTQGILVLPGGQLLRGAFDLANAKRV